MNDHYHDDRDRIHELRRDDQYAPTADEIKAALDTIASSEPTEIPNVKTIRTLQDADMIPVSVEDKRLVRATIQPGQPRNGEMRSDDHISDYIVEYDAHCPECDKLTRHRHEYHANHFIAGRMKVGCKACDTVHDSDSWG